MRSPGNIPVLAWVASIRRGLKAWAWRRAFPPAHVLIDTCLVLFVLNSAVLVIYLAREGSDHFRFSVTLAVTGAVVLCPLVLRLTGRLGWALLLVTGPCFVGALFLAVRAGGLGAPTTLLLILMPTLVNLVFGDYAGLRTLVLCMVSLGGLAAYTGPRPTADIETRPSVLVHLMVCWLATVAMHEIVRRYRLRDRDNQRRLERQERLAGLGTLAAGVAHEINNPLSVIVLNTELLLDTVESGEVRPLLSDISRSTDQIRFIVDQLRESSAPSVLSLSPQPLLEVLGEALGQLRARFPGAAEVQLGVNAAVLVRGARPVLLQIFVNLLVNAQHALKSQSRGIIRVEHSDDRGFDVVSVVDNGPGFPEQLLDRLAEPFVTTRAAAGGTGLGLFIVDSRVRELGGTVRFGIADSGGARVQVRLPKCDRELGGASASAGRSSGGAPEGEAE